MEERLGKGSKSRPPKLDKKVEDIIAENQRLRLEIEYPKIGCLSSRTGEAWKQEKAIIVSELRQKYPLNDLLKLSGIARSTYYYYSNQINIDKYALEKAAIKELIEKTIVQE